MDRAGFEPNWVQVSRFFEGKKFIFHNFKQNFMVAQAPPARVQIRRHSNPNGFKPHLAKNNAAFFQNFFFL
jgi:hypothetical protein